MKKLILFIATITSLNSFAQNIQWADVIADFSSEASEKQFSANQVLGEPSAYPANDYNPTSWSPKKESSGKGEFIKKRPCQKNI